MNSLQIKGFQHGEREFALDEAERRLHSAMAESGLTAKLDCYGGDPPCGAAS